MKLLRTQDVRVDDLVLHPDNPRKGNLDAIKESLQAYGQYTPILARFDDRVVLAGNHRLMAARELGWDKIRVQWIEATDREAKAILLADNRTSDLGSYDESALGNLLRSFEGDFTGTGYDLDFADRLFTKLTPPVPAATDEESANDGDDAGSTRMWVGHYQLVFDTEWQRLWWNAFLRYLRSAYEGETATDRVMAYLETAMPDGVLPPKDVDAAPEQQSVADEASGEPSGDLPGEEWDGADDAEGVAAESTA